MTKKQLPLLLVAALCVCFTALALSNSKGVTTTPLMKTSTTWNGAPIAYPTGEAEISALIVEIAPGAETGWHKHGVPSFAYMLEGTIEVELKDGSKHQLKAGETLAEVIDTFHNGRNLGDCPAKLVVFYAGAKGSTLTIKEMEDGISAL